jgi:outer membrane lipoprotein-sorting protein
MKTVICLFAMTLAAPLVLAQTPAPKLPAVNEILARYERAMGGKAEFAKVNTMVFRGTIEFPSYNLSGTTTEYFKAPDRFLAVTEIPGYGTQRTAYDGKTAWSDDPKQGVKEITGAALADMRRRADIQWPVKLKELYPGLHLMGGETIEGKDAWVLEVTQDQWTFRLCFDVITGLMIRFDTDTGEKDGISQVFIGDYRQVANMQFSYAARMSTTKVIWTRKLSEVKFNVPVDDALFQKKSLAEDVDKKPEA